LILVLCLGTRFANIVTLWQRKVFLLCPLTKQSFEALVDLPSNLPSASGPVKPVVKRWAHLEGNEQLSLQVEELLWAEVICREHPKVQAIAREVGVEPENLFCDGALGSEKSLPTPHDP
jgi:primary-amine oxidase